MMHCLFLSSSDVLTRAFVIVFLPSMSTTFCILERMPSDKLVFGSSQSCNYSISSFEYQRNRRSRFHETLPVIPSSSKRNRRERRKDRTCAWQRELKDVIFLRDFSLEADVEEWRIHCPFVIPLKLYRVINLRRSKNIQYSVKMKIV